MSADKKTLGELFTETEKIGRELARYASLPAPHYPENRTGRWLTTNREAGPTGVKVPNTFRDVSLRNLKCEYVDAFDFICLQKNLRRSDLFKLMETMDIDDPRQMLGEDRDLPDIETVFQIYHPQDP